MAQGGSEPKELIEDEISEAVVIVCRRVQQYLAAYEGRSECTLDCLIYHVERLYHKLVTYDKCSNHVLDVIAKN